MCTLVAPIKLSILRFLTQSGNTGNVEIGMDSTGSHSMYPNID